MELPMWIRSGTIDLTPAGLTSMLALETGHGGGSTTANIPNRLQSHPVPLYLRLPVVYRPLAP